MNGLTEPQQSLLMFIAVAITTTNIYLAAVDGVPKWVIVVFGAMSAISVVAKEMLGAKRSQIADTVKSLPPTNP